MAGTSATRTPSGPSLANMQSQPVMVLVPAALPFQSALFLHRQDFPLRIAGYHEIAAGFSWARPADTEALAKFTASLWPEAKDVICAVHPR